MLVFLITKLLLISVIITQRINIVFMASIWVKNISLRHLLDLFFASAVAAVLVTRVFLAISGYPSIGGDSLHIAHVLWGGFFMLAANILLLSFLGNRVRNLAAVIGGIGFGLFIDEVGKFITRDNNYFFQPSIMIIYLVFVGLYFIFRELEERSSVSESDKVVNAIGLAQDYYLEDFDFGEQKHLKDLLQEISPQNPLHPALLELANKKDLRSVNGRLYLIQRFAGRQFLKLINHPWFVQITVFLFFVQAILISLSLSAFKPQAFLSLSETIILVFGFMSAAIASIYFFWGLLKYRRNITTAYRYFYRSNLLLVLITQPFIFYIATFVPLIALAINLTSLFCLRYIIDKQLHLVGKEPR